MNFRSGVGSGSIVPACALLLFASLGCSSGGSAFANGGASSQGSGGTPGSGGTGTNSGSAGSVANTGGSSAMGNGGSGVAGSGAGSAGSAGSGGTESTGAGGTPAGSGGSSGTGTAGSMGGETGGGAGVGTGQSDAGSGGGPAAGPADASVAPACPKPAGQICHEFIANDNSRNQINYVNEFTGKGWTVNVGDTTVNSPRTIEIVDNARAKAGKAILVSLNRGYGEFDLVDGTSLVKVLNSANVTGASRLPDGSTALGVCPPAGAVCSNASIRFVTATGTEIRNFALPAGLDLRAINRDPATGNFWFSLTENVYEVSPQGAQLFTAFMGAGSKGYAVWWRPGGGAYATTGDPSTVVEIDGNKSILTQVGGKTKFPFLDFFSGFVRLANGNYVVANWLGHIAAPAAATPHVVELTADNQLVWQWGNQTLARQITNVFLFR